MKHFFISDPHFGHGNILRYSKRVKFLTEEEKRLALRGEQFKVRQDSIDKHDSAIIKNTNDMVSEDDHLWFIGDWCKWGGAQYYQRARYYRQRVNCKNIHLIRGNHDTRIIADLFTSIHDQVQIAIGHEGEFWVDQDVIGKDKRARHQQQIVLNHYMMAVWPKNGNGSWQLYGHSHTAAEKWADRCLPGRKSIDVGVDNAFKVLGEYRPFAYEELQEIFAGKPGCAIDYH